VRFAFLVLIAAAGCSRTDPEVDRLLNELRDGNPDGRALADLDATHADGVPAILEAIEQDERRFVRTTCIEALLSVGAGKDALPTVTRVLRDRDPIVADRAALIHWKISRRFEPGLARLLARARAHATARLLLRRAPPLPAPIARRISEEADLSALAAIGPPVAAALPRVESSLTSDSVDTRLLAAEAHFRISGRLQPALDLLVREFETDNVFLRQRIHAVWMEMLSAHPEAMRAEVESWKTGDSEPLKAMATQMLRE
jgi:HEAT repeat protein